MDAKCLLFQSLFQGLCVELAQVDPVQAVFLGQEEGLGDVVGDGNHLAVFLTLVQKLPGMLGTGGIIQVKNLGIAYHANAEVASGTKKRWLGRAFALGFSDNFRVTLYGNVNNMGESQYIGQIGHFSSGLQPRSLTKI